ncbi:hypothetical protein IAT38_001443 [Cryptococcus sp. DSM 104549]
MLETRQGEPDMKSNGINQFQASARQVLSSHGRTHVAAKMRYMEKAIAVLRKRGWGSPSKPVLASTKSARSMARAYEACGPRVKRGTTCQAVGSGMRHAACARQERKCTSYTTRPAPTPINLSTLSAERLTVK